MKEDLLKIKREIDERRIYDWFDENVNFRKITRVNIAWIDKIPYIDVKGHVELWTPDDYILEELPSFINFGRISGKFSISANYQFKSTRGFPKVCEGVYCYVERRILYRIDGFKGNWYNKSSHGEVCENGAHTNGTFEDYEYARQFLLENR